MELSKGENASKIVRLGSVILTYYTSSWNMNLFLLKHVLSQQDEAPLKFSISRSDTQQIIIHNVKEVSGSINHGLEPCIQN